MVGPLEVTLNPPVLHGAGEFPIAITTPLGSFSPPRSIEPEDPDIPKPKDIFVLPDTVNTIEAT